MSDLLFSGDGTPLLGFGMGHVGFDMITKGGPAGVRPDVSKSTEYLQDKLTLDGHNLVNWGADNNFPGKANEMIRSVGVLNTGLKFMRNFTLGQGIFPVEVTGYDDQGNEQLKVINNPELTAFCESRLCRQYMEIAMRDYFKFGLANVQMIPNENGSKLVGLNSLNSMYCRYSEAKSGIIEKIFVSGRWPENPGKGEYETFDLLDNYDPIADLQRRKWGDELKGKSVVYAVKDSWSNNDYYPEPLWWSAYLAGWVDVARVVPKFMLKAYANQVTWKWHIKIPYAFWDRRFPKEEYKTVELRRDAIQEYMDAIENNICSQENADKPIFTFYEINPNNGKAEEQWIIESLDNKSKEGDRLVTSAAANSEIMFAMMLNPNVLGAGMPGGVYSGNQGGSNIREAFLVNIANAWLDRQNLLDPLEAFLQYNGVTGVQLRFRNTILTTLDTGAGTTKKLS
jgi:hypothetical protein